MPTNPGPLPLLESPSSSNVKCQICHTQAAKYTCPNCNLRYCSLVCFRSEKHGDCSETFYKDSIINEVQGRNDVNPEEKTKVMDMLRRLQEADAGGLEDEDEDEDDGESGLAAALEDLDIDNLSPEQLLAYLSPEQRKAFEDILKDPERAAKLLQDDDTATRQIFWWQQSVLDDGENRPDRKGKGKAAPAPLPVDKLLAMSSQEGLRLEYNLLAILTAYGLAHRLWTDEDNVEERQKALGRLLPFIVAKSTLVLKTAEEALNYVVANVRSDLIQDRRKLLLLLLEDAAAFLFIPPISFAEEAGDKTFLALSDMHTLLSTFTTRNSKKAGFPLAGPKILFYASNLQRIPRTKLLQNVQRYRERLQLEEVEDSTLGRNAQEPLALKPSRPREADRPKIEEIA